MKWILLTLWCFSTLNLLAPIHTDKVETEIRQSYENYEKVQAKRRLLLNAVSHIESRGNPKAFNKSENAAGELQIRPVMVREINRILGIKKYTLSDRFNPNKSREMFWIFQEKYNPTFDYYIGLHIWNAGACIVIKRWHLTEKYRKLGLNYAAQHSKT